MMQLELGSKKQLLNGELEMHIFLGGPVMQKDAYVWDFCLFWRRNGKAGRPDILVSFFVFLFSELSEGCLDLCFAYRRRGISASVADPILPKLILTTGNMT